jgi:predicted transposase YbfD/YdcC
VLILRSLCDFLIPVKKNCPKLYAAIHLYMLSAQPVSCYETQDKGHGRTEWRHIELFVNCKSAKLPKSWKGIQRLAKVRHWGFRQGKPFDHTAVYILSKPLNCAQSVAKGIRGHWGIENGLHWTKDVILGEDDMKMKQANMATTVSYFNTIALNLIRLNGYKPIKNTFAIFTNKIKELNNLFNISGAT